MNEWIKFKKKKDLVEWFVNQNPDTVISWRYYAAGQTHATVGEVIKTLDISQIKKWRTFHVYVEEIAPNFAFGA